MQNQWLNYHHLYYFRVIATEGGIVKAAKKLRLGQPTLSTQLKQFEDQLGQKLFERRKKRLYLTEAGRIALEYAEEIFKLGDEMQDALGDRLKEDRIFMQLGSVDSIPKSIPLRLMQEAQSYGPCTVSIAEGANDLLLRDLRDHKLDLVLSNHPPSLSEAQGLYAKKIGSSPLIICASRSLAKNIKRFPQDLSGQPFIIPTAPSRVRSDFERYLKAEGIQAEIVAEVQDTSLQVLLATHSLGFLPITEHAASELIERKELISLGQAGQVQEEFWLIARERKIENPLASHVMKHFRL